MRKLKLDLDRLSVESFATDVSARRGGTVRGAEYDTVDWGLGPQQDSPVVGRPDVPSSSDPSNYTCASGGPVCCA